MTTPGKPRQSGIPGPGRISSIPTPGRSRSSSTIHQHNPTTPVDDISRAFADAIKANDPSIHRNILQPGRSSTTSLSPQSVSYSLSSGRRSVVGRPSSAASVSSTSAAPSRISERAKTPTSARMISRPPSRHSDVVGKPKKAFEVGDNVRIESLGFEGTLRYLGEIDGKPGLWAGIELSGGFVSKGKNNGTVGGKQYFSCPDNCGVFIATTKLSSPTVGPGAIQRPSSVASTRGGRTTPASSGRITPSFFTTSRTPSATFSNGRVTPSTGRTTPATNGWVTPGTTPAANVRRTFKTPTSKSTTTSLTDKITAGSRAAKYMSMTAKQLSSRDRNDRAESPVLGGGENLNSAMFPAIQRTMSSPTSQPGSPFSTPKAGLGRLSHVGGTSPARSQSTVRVRIPSSVAMPPPPSPKHIPNRALGTEENSPKKTEIYDTLMVKEKLLPLASSSSRPESSTSFRSTGTDELNLIEQLQSRLDAVEYENERLRTASDVDVGGQLKMLQSERQEIIDRSLRLEGEISLLESKLASHTSQIETFHTEKESLTAQLTISQSEALASQLARQQDLDTHAGQLKTLQEEIDNYSRANSQKDNIIKSNALVIENLSAKFERVCGEFEEERKELSMQIDELRTAGQETIALYEERLSAAESLRYEHEQNISSLEAGLRSMKAGEGSRESASQIPLSATQIDNERLQEQLRHYSERCTKLEEKLEDARATLERDGHTYQEKIAQLRHDDGQRKRDLAAKTKEVEQLMKSEGLVRLRVEEIEEALRESTVALENTRAELEMLRAELANLDVLVGDSSEGDISSRIAAFAKKASADRTRYEQEICRMEKLLGELQADKHDSGSDGNTSLTISLQRTVSALTSQINSLNGRNADLERKLSESLLNLEDRTQELETIRKKSNRDVPFGVQDAHKTISLKYDTSTLKEEVAGLKHIVQDLQKENLAATQRIKYLESENQLLSSEAEQLRQEVRVLEENLDNSLKEEMSALENPSTPNTGNEDGRQRNSKERNVQLEGELEQMRKRSNEAEIKHARVVHDLNKEISELEALVESKIYREDELEQEVERLKEKISRHKKMSKSSHDLEEGRNRLSSVSSSTESSDNLSARGQVCEICERPGHDIFSCSMLRDDVGMNSRSSTTPMFCEDCESPGHVAADCPHSLDVF
ncbi:hypothetical protein BYT27DRAFT_7083346 [Phlegmacium glaucopus]|nr:hypothetical protein BYT27DRAFT_7083346 [Phlegmacium glaucopus]